MSHETPVNQSAGWGIPCSPTVRTPSFQCQHLGSILRELRSHKLQGLGSPKNGGYKTVYIPWSQFYKYTFTQTFKSRNSSVSTVPQPHVSGHRISAPGPPVPLQALAVLGKGPPHQAYLGDLVLKAQLLPFTPSLRVRMNWM